MADPGPRFWEIFFEVYEALPRQGPGDRASAARALALCGPLPPKPSILDVGCGAGGQTLHLAELTDGDILAVDSHAPLIARLNATIAARGLTERVRAVVGDMARSPAEPHSFDLIWSEGALYQIGIGKALEVCRGLLRPGGAVAFTDAVWRTDNPPPEVKAAFEADYPAMGREEDVAAEIAANGFELLGHFTLPDTAWWTDFYTPMERRIAALRRAYANAPADLAILDQISQEPEMHRRFSHTYAYVFFIARRPAGRLS